jgi:hypothetical protein
MYLKWQKDRKRVSRISDDVRAMDKKKTKNVQLGLEIHSRTRGVEPRAASELSDLSIHTLTR